MAECSFTGLDFFHASHHRQSAGPLLRANCDLFHISCERASKSGRTRGIPPETPCSVKSAEKWAQISMDAFQRPRDKPQNSGCKNGSANDSLRLVAARWAGQVTRVDKISGHCWNGVAQHDRFGILVGAVCGALPASHARHRSFVARSAKVANPMLAWSVPDKNP